MSMDRYYEHPPEQPQYNQPPTRRERGAAGRVILGFVVGAVIGAGGMHKLEEHDATFGLTVSTAESSQAPSPTGSDSASATPSDALSASPTESTSPSPATQAPRTAKPPRPTLGANQPVVPRHNRAASPVVVLDPGHDGISRDTVDTKTGLKMKQYTNEPEIEEVFQVAKMVKRKLVADGYTVYLTKQSAQDSATYRERAKLAIRHNADLEVIIHDDHTQRLKSFQAVYAPPMGGYRIGSKGKVACENQEVIVKSEKAAHKIAAARSAIQGVPATMQTLDFNNRSGFDPGNISQIQLFDCLGNVPSVYNEMGALTDGSGTKSLPQKALAKYALGLTAGIEAALPTRG